MDSLQLIHERVEALKTNAKGRICDYNPSDRIRNLENMEMDIITQQRYCRLYGEREARVYEKDRH